MDPMVAVERWCFFFFFSRALLNFRLFGRPKQNTSMKFIEKQ